MLNFEKSYTDWLDKNIQEENNPRRKELLKKQLGFGTVEFLKKIWYPTVGNFDYLYPEWEVRDYNNRYRYLDLAYMPANTKGCIEIQGYGPHARDIDVSRFKDLCWRHSLLALEGWTILPIAFLSIQEETKLCQQLILSFVGKFIASNVEVSLSWLETEVIRFARRIPRPITPLEIAKHLSICDRHARRILRNLVDMQILAVASGNARRRAYILLEHQ